MANGEPLVLEAKAIKRRQRGIKELGSKPGSTWKPSRECSYPVAIAAPA